MELIHMYGTYCNLIYAEALVTANELLLLDKLFGFMHCHSGSKASLWNKLVVISGIHKKQAEIGKRKKKKKPWRLVSENSLTGQTCLYCFNYLVLIHIKSPLIATGSGHCCFYFIKIHVSWILKTLCSLEMEVWRVWKQTRESYFSSLV